MNVAVIHVEVFSNLVVGNILKRGNKQKRRREISV